MFALAACLTACANHGAEQQLLDQFFSASRLRDRTALQPIATVIFEPREQGTVAAFTIVKVDDLEHANGEVVSKQVTVSAPVRLPDGQTATKKIILVLRRRDRWMVTGFTVGSPLTTAPSVLLRSDLRLVTDQPAQARAAG